MREEVHKAALAGLLHDVGKLGRLAGELAQGPYAHALIGDRFVNQCVPEQWRPAMAPVGWHHGDRENGKLKQPVEKLGLQVKIVALADRLSSGERETHQDDTPKTKQLLSVFGRVKVPKDSEKDTGERPWEARAYLIPSKLKLSRDVIFPSSSPVADLDRRLEELWEGLKRDAAALQGVYSSDDAGIGSYLESMFYLLRDYTWCVPSAYVRSEPDVSLFAHLHTTAALAACLAHSVHVAESLKEADIDVLLEGIKGESWPAEPTIAWLLGGDISGIQDFIYSLHDPEGAAASLRARSFYLQVLTEVIARWILRKLELPITNALYIGGGGFTLLVPPLQEEKLAEFRREINSVLFKAHGIELYLGLAQVELVPRDFLIPKEGIPTLAEKREELGRRLEMAKARRFSELEEDGLKELFGPRGFGGGAAEGEAKVTTCQVCGKEAAKEEMEEVDSVRFCPGCLAFRDLGRELRGAEYLFLGEIEPSPELKTPAPTYADVLAAFGYKIELFADLKSLKDLPPERPAVLYALKDEADLPSFAGPRLAVGRKFTVNLVPTIKKEELTEIHELLRRDENKPGEGDIKHFGILARQSEGAPYLGVLRMDMDNLGKIFSQGLGNLTSLSRTSTLSFLISLFFEGWTEAIAREIDAKKGVSCIYAVYSGGDDLFFVGSWDAIVELSRRIRKDLFAFTAREELGISGGIVLVHEKYPLYVAAKDADKAERAAKDIKRSDGRGKDAIAFLGIPLPWEEFGFDDRGGTASDWAKRLKGMVSANRLPRAVLGRLQNFYSHYLSDRKKRGEIGPWVWHAAYWLSRMRERLRDEEAKGLLEELREELSAAGFSRNIARLALAARWAELSTRERR